MSSACSTCGDCGGCEGPATLVSSEVRRVALVGNPNVGKTTLFNALTGLRQKIGNYPGVTVERKLGRMYGPVEADLLDLPGTYSLVPRSLDEDIAFRALIGALDEPAPDMVLCVADATNLERNLFLTLQVIELGLPTVLVLNMMDEAEREGLAVDVEALRGMLGIPVVAVSATRRRGLAALRALVAAPPPATVPRLWIAQPAVRSRVEMLGDLLPPGVTGAALNPAALALRALVDEQALALWQHEAPAFVRAVHDARDELRALSVHPRQAEQEDRYAVATAMAARVLATGVAPASLPLTDRIDAWLTHRVMGPVVFVAILFLVFQAVFSWATPLMDGIEWGIGLLGRHVGALLPEGFARDLVVEGLFAGVGSVLVFLPQILLLFFFLGLLEDTGYMARAAFISDRLMNRLGLSGHSVVPLVSGYACAVPAIMATRTIANHRDRLVTMMVIPLMSCSARLPVYTLFIAAFIPTERLFGVVGYQGLVLFGLYAASTVVALAAAYVLKNRVVRGGSSLLVIELPPYRLPQWRDVLWRMVDRARMFVTKAGKIILLMSIVLWFLASFPRVPMAPELEVRRVAAERVLQREAGTDERAAKTRYDEALAVIEAEHAGEQIRQSYVGQFGRLIEPVMRPLGFDWKISAGIVTAFAAREVLVSTLATLYSLGDSGEDSTVLHERLRSDVDPDTGEQVFTPLVAVSLMVFVMLACQCMSTLAITRRETNSWRWPAFMFAYMTALAYVASLVIYQAGRWMGLG